MTRLVNDICQSVKVSKSTLGIIAKYNKVRTVNASSNPIIAVLVSVDTITSKVVALVRTQISLDVSTVIAEHCACHAGPAAE